LGLIHRYPKKTLQQPAEKIRVIPEEAIYMVYPALSALQQSPCIRFTGHLKNSFNALAGIVTSQPVLELVCKINADTNTNPE
jgi:hypothetical protein